MRFTLSYYRLFVLSLLVLIFNVKVVSGFDFSNAIEKLFFLVTCAYAFWSGRIDKWAIRGCVFAIIICLFSAVMSSNEGISYFILFKALTQLVILFFFTWCCC